MGKFILATDSTSCLHYIAPQEKDIEILPLYLFMDEERRRDCVDIDISEFLQWMRDHPKALPYSSPPTEYDVDVMIRRWIKKGYDEALFVSLSGAISQTYYLVRKVAEKYKHQIRIVVFDSRSQSFAQVILLLEGKRLLEQGHNLSATVTQLEFIRRRGRMFFTLPTLSYLVRNGRLDARKAMFARILRLNPILSFDDEGKIVPLDKAQGLKKALQSCLGRCARFVNGRPADVFVSHSGDKQGVEFQRKVERYFPDTQVVSVLPSPVIACHTGPGLYGIGAFVR